MKKCRGYLLTVTLLLATLLSGCTPKQAKVPALLDCGTVEGMLMHTSKTKYSYSDVAGAVSTKSSLFVPAGTVITSEKEIAVYTYDKYNELNTATLAAIGQDTVGEYIVMMAPGARTVTEDVYVRVTVKGTIEDVVITYPEERRHEVRVFDPEYEAYGKDCDRLLPLIDKTEKAAVNYLFLTDVHNDRDNNSEMQCKSLEKQVESAVKLANESDAIDFIVVGGDNTSGHYADKATSLSYLHQLFEPLKECKKPVLMLMGNHDDNSYSCAVHPYTEAEAANLVSKAQWNSEVLKTYSPSAIVHDSQKADSAYYYYDLPKKKTRLICLDAIDYAQQTDENGTILASSLSTDGKGNSAVGRNYWGYSARQLTWLAEEALTAEDGWNYLFFSHMNVQKSYSYGAELHELLAAFKSRAVYTNDELGTMDFTKASGKIMLYQYGHVHVEQMTEDATLGSWCVATSSANIAQLSGNKKGNEGYRAFGTDTECCFDVMSVTEEKALKYAFGAGKDAELKTP